MAEMIDKGKVDMSNNINQEDKGKRSVIIPFTSIAGGTDGTGPWILNQPRGAVVLVKNEDPSSEGKKDPLLREFVVLDKDDHCVHIANFKKKIDEWVDAERFCKLWSLAKLQCILDLNKMYLNQMHELEEK